MQIKIGFFLSLSLSLFPLSFSKQSLIFFLCAFRFNQDCYHPGTMRQQECKHFQRLFFCVCMSLRGYWRCRLFCPFLSPIYAKKGLFLFCARTKMAPYGIQCVTVLYIVPQRALRNLSNIMSVPICAVRLYIIYYTYKTYNIYYILRVLCIVLYA